MIPALLSNVNSIYPANTARPIQKQTISVLNEEIEIRILEVAPSGERAIVIEKENIHRNANPRPTRINIDAIPRLDHNPKSVLGNFLSIHITNL